MIKSLTSTISNFLYRLRTCKNLVVIALLCIFILPADSDTRAKTYRPPAHFVFSFEQEFQTLVTTRFQMISDWNRRDPELIGICYPSRNFVEIRESFWAKASDPEREALVFHELGHCHFWLSHHNTLRDDGCPERLMHPVVVGESCYLKRRSEYVDLMLNASGTGPYLPIFDSF